MSSDPSNIGMMEGAFFVPATQLIRWVNETLALNVTKIEQCATGSIYAQVIDACHPGKVSMGKLKWAARSEYEYIQNFKVLQQALQTLGVTRFVDVEKLVRAKYQDNLEMLQWTKAYYDKVGAAENYNPVRRRGNLPPSGLPDWIQAGGHAMKENVRPDSGIKGKESTKETRTRPSVAGRPRASVAARDSVAPRDSAMVEKLRDELDQLRETAQGLERERDFYFGKLRDIEIECQNYEAQPDPNLSAEKFIGTIFKVLYATDDEDAPEDSKLASK